MKKYNSEQKLKANIRLSIAVARDKEARRKKMSRRGKLLFLAFLLTLFVVMWEVS